MLLKISQNSQKSNCSKIFFFNKAATLLKKRLLHRWIWEFCEFSKNTFFTEHLWATTNERLDKISKDVTEVTKSLEFTRSTLDEELATVKNDIKKLASDMKELENNLLDPKEVSEKS